MKPAIGVAVLVAAAMLAPLAAAETVVPPGNSAATQYTEAFPTAGGNAKSDGGSKGASPTKVLGAHNAHKLESKGPVGEEVATLSAETAPVVAPAPRGTGQRHAAAHRRGKANGATGGAAANAGGGGSGPDAGTPVTASDGSSGFGEVLAQATGSSSGQLGLFLPLIVIGTVLWSLNYLWRQRRRLG